jgi:hypothetical protein
VNYYSLSLVFVNILLCFWRTGTALKNRSLLLVPWALISYHAIFFIFPVIEGQYTKYKAFNGTIVTVRESTIYDMCVYVVLFNSIFAITEIFVRYFIKAKQTNNWELSKSDTWLNCACTIYGLFLFGGSVFYFIKMQGFGYREYVEYVGSNWTIVFLWAGTPFISLCCLQKRYKIAFIAVLPFLIFSFLLKIRSFLLLSLIPAFIIVFYQNIYILKRLKISVIIISIIIMFSFLILVSSIIIFYKTGRVHILPDVGMGYGFGIVLEVLNKTNNYLGFNSLIKYFYNLANPFLKMFEILEIYKRTEIIDTPVYLANIIDGAPLNYKTYYHYPALWYSDAFLCFGYNGLFLAAIWAGVNLIFEKIMSHNVLMLGIFLPFFTWHSYMLIRGATAGATVPFSYAFYFAMIVAIIFMPLKIFSR